MSKFMVVKKAPEQLKKGEFLIDTPSFLEEVKLNSNKKPKNGLTGNFYIRAITETIVQKYDKENMNPYVLKLKIDQIIQS